MKNSIKYTALKKYKPVRFRARTNGNLVGFKIRKEEQ